MGDLMMVSLHATTRFSFAGSPNSVSDSIQGDGRPQRRVVLYGGGHIFGGNSPGNSWPDCAAAAFG